MATIPNYSGAENYGFNAPSILNGTRTGWTRMGDDALLSMSAHRRADVMSIDVSGHPHVVRLAKRARRRQRMRRKQRRGY